MCGRYTQTASLKELRERFKLSAVDLFDLKPRFNIAPSQDAPVIVEENGRALKHFRWGLVPSWAKEAAIGYKMINARAETVTEKPSYKKPFQSRRCLVIADGFYEWKRLDAKAKQPMRIVLKSRQPFAMAGLWESWKGPDGKPLLTFTIITTSANDAMRPIHDRMPVILAAQDEAAWLDPAAPHEKLTALLRASAEPLETYPVSPLVNSPRNDTPACIDKVLGPPPELF